MNDDLMSRINALGYTYRSVLRRVLVLKIDVNVYLTIKELGLKAYKCIHDANKRKIEIGDYVKHLQCIKNLGVTLDGYFTLYDEHLDKTEEYILNEREKIIDCMLTNKLHVKCKRACIYFPDKCIFKNKLDYHKCNGNLNCLI